MTKMNERDLTPLGLRLLLAAGASALALGTANAWAQDDLDEVDLIEESDEVEETEDEIVVTGSRIRRSTFTSISPLQVISAQDSLDVGLVDPSAILQQSEAAAGQQIDATFQGFVLDNGPGSQTLNLRGLGADRTLLLINGRRFAPAGVEGAPSNPSLNLIPGSLVERYDLLLDGASSVYGSDAVAGVGNIILKKDFDGFEVFAAGDYNQDGAGHDFTLSGAWGKNTDRGFFGIGAEYDFRDEVTRGDRPFLAGCETNYEITEDGDIRTVSVFDDLNFRDRTDGQIGAPRNACIPDRISGVALFPFQSYGFVYPVDGDGNSGIPGFSVEELGGGIPIDSDGDGIVDVDRLDYDTNGAQLDSSLFSRRERISVMSYGEYTFDGAANLTPFFEFLFTSQDIDSDNGQFQLFPAVPFNNPFNPCNIGRSPLTGGAIEAADGAVDCAGAEVTLLGRPGGNAGFSLPVLPVLSIPGDRENNDITLAQYRFVGGVRGDLPFMNVGSLSDWTFEVSGVYSYSDSDSVTTGIREDRLAAGLGIDPTNDADGNGIYDDYEAQAYFPPLLNAPCDFSDVLNPDLLTADVTDGCVAVNLFADDAIGRPVGDLSQAERDYVFGERTFETSYEQILFNAFVTGTVAELPAGPVAVVLGAEYRRDEVDSQPNDVASNGLFFGFSADQGAQGSKDITEVFGEVEIPVLGGKPLARELLVKASTRYTDEEFYGSAWTYAVSTGWRPFDPLLLKASFGTSFRAPNLRENFLQERTGFATLTDPCAVPTGAIDPNTGEYIGDIVPGTDTRQPEVFENCRREGRDPLSVGVDQTANNSQRTNSVQIATRGSLDLLPETSESFTMGASFDQPFFDSFDLNLNVNFYDIEIKDAVLSPGGQFILNDCFARATGGRSPFCDRIGFQDATTPGSRGLANSVDAGFINRDSETVSGLDYNLIFGYEFDAFDQPMDFGLNIRANQLKERTTLFINENGEPDLDEFQGEFGFPEWTGTGTATLDVADYRLTYQVRYIGEVEQDDAQIDAFSDAFGSGFGPTGIQFFGDTCGGPTVGDVLCRDVGFADAWTEHRVSLRWEGETMIIRGGVSNLFDNRPPLVDGNEVFSISNVPIGNGYNLDGREYFVSVSKEF